MARKFELKTIAEWVETPEDAAFLRQWGADYLQGNLFGKASLDIPWSAEAAAAPEKPASQEEPATFAAKGKAQADGDDEEPDISRLRLAIDALNAQFRKGRG